MELYMRKFKLQLVGSLVAIIVIIVTLLVVLSDYSFKTESINLNKINLAEKNATIEATLTEKFQSYQNVISALEVSSSDVKNGALSEHVVFQLKTMQRAQRKVSDGLYVFTRDGDLGVFFSQNKFEIDEGDCFVMKATPKRHQVSNYHGGKETMFNRVVIKDVVGKKE